MKHKKNTLGEVWENCTETECKNKKDVNLCCAILIFGGSQFGDDSCLKRLNKSKAKSSVSQESMEKK
jgi:hypothetical protein